MPPAHRNPPVTGVLLAFDGVVHCSDLPVQSFARHLTDPLPADGVRTLIAGMRGFLEDKPDLIPAGVDLSAAEDGYQAVETIARSAGLTDGQITDARVRSRVDLAASAWAVDASDGLAELLAGTAATTYVGVLTEPGDPAASVVLDSLDIDVGEVFDVPLIRALAQVLASLDTPDPARVLVIGAGWSGYLSEADRAGCGTALVDRYGLERGAPTIRSPDLASLVGPVNRWRIGAERLRAAAS